MSRIRSSTPVSGQPSAGPSSSANTATVGTPASIKDIGTEIINTIENLPEQQKTPAAVALAATLQSRISTIYASLEARQETDESIQTDLDLIITTLQEIRIVLKAKPTLRKREKIASKLFGMHVGTKGPDPYLSLRVKVEDGFQALEMRIVAFRDRAATAAPTTKVSQQPLLDKSVLADGDLTPQASEPTGRYHTAIDAVEKALEATSAVSDFIPAPAGTIVKVITAVGLSIVTMLKDVAGNNEESVGLARHLAELVQTIIQFVRDGGNSIRDVTLAQLELFKNELEAVKMELTDLSAQGRIKKAISHGRNKDVLSGCDTQIRRAFTQLQVYLSLDATRLLTSLGDAEARREADRLLGLLGDLDTGARDKADDPADLVCLPGTRMELLNDVRHWIDDALSERVLWISGVAGCGKSAVAATVASQQDGLSASAIFHFSRGNQGRNDRFICCLARQLARWNHASLEHLVLAAVQKYPDIATMHFSAQFQHLIVEPLKKLVPGAPPVLIVVDALDEWDKQESAAKLVDLIHRSNADLHPSVKFILTSRNEAHLSKAFRSPLLKTLVKCCALDNTLGPIVDRDIKLYLEKWFTDIRSSSEELEGSEWPGADGVNELVKLSGGLFQWASTAIRYISAGHPPVRLEDIRANPNQLGDLDLLYRHILGSLFQQSPRPSTLPLLQHVLGFIVVAPTPISLNTIAYLLAEDASLLPAKTAEVRVEILAVLGAFLIIPTDPNLPIRVLHPSIIDFLTDLGRCPDLRFYIERVPHNQTTAILCFRRMSRDLKRDICGINDPTKFNSDIQDAIFQYISEPLRYVCRYWASHLSVSGEVPPRKLADLVDHFCNKLVLFWLEVVSLTGTVHQGISSIRAAEEWALTASSNSIANDNWQLLYEARRFLLAYSAPISTNVHHIYLSTLASTPSRTHFLRTYRESATAGIQILRGPVDKYWPASLWVADRHSDVVMCVALSLDGKTVVSGSGDKTVRLWDVETGTQRGDALEGHSGSVNSVAFASDGKTVVSGSDDMTVRLWDVETGMQKGDSLNGHSGSVNSVAFASEGKTVVSGSDDMTIRLWDVETGTQRGNTLEGHSDWVNSVAFASDGKTVASGSNDKTVRLWDVEAGMQIGGAMEGHSDQVHSVAFAPDGKIVVSSSSDNTARLWDVETGTQRGGALEGHSRPVCSVAFASDGKTVVSGSLDQTIRLWDVETTTQRGNALEGHSSWVRSVAFASNCKAVVSGSDDKTLRLWDVETGIQEGNTLESHYRWVSSIAFTLDGKTLVSGSYDKTVRLWDIDTGTQRGNALEGHSDWVNSVAFASDGKTVVSGSKDTTVRLWDVETGTQRGDALEGHSGSVSSVAFASDGKTVVSGSDDMTVRLWDVENETQRGDALKGHFKQVNSVAFASDGKTVASGSNDETVRLWDVDAGTQRGDALEGHSSQVHSVTFASDSKTVVSGSHDGTVRLWDVDTSTQKGNPLFVGFDVRSLAFSSDGQHLHVVGVDNFAFLYQQWDLTSGTPMHLPPSNSVGVSAAGLAPVKVTISRDGWVCYGDQRWFWLPAAFGRDVVGDLLGDRFVFHHDRYVCIIDVSKVLYIIQ